MQTPKMDPEGDTADGQLVAAALQGDRRAFAQLVQRYVRLAGAVAYGVVRNHDQAADVVQQAFFKAQARLVQLNDGRRFKVWLCGIVRTTALDDLRKSKRRPEAGVEPERLAECRGPEQWQPEVRVAQREVDLLVRQAVDALPQDYREVVVLKHLDGRSYAEIAELLGVSVATVESRLFRARQALRKQLGVKGSRLLNG